MRAQLRAGLAAIAFLTRLPIHRAGSRSTATTSPRAGPYFPLVGAAIGAGTGRSRRRRFAPAPRTAARRRARSQRATLVTGALHLDALADTADASGAQPRERALEIMRDPAGRRLRRQRDHLDLLIKAAALAALAAIAGDACRGAAAGALSRAVPVVLGAALPYARAGGGTGDAMTGASGRGRGRRATARRCSSTAALGRDGLRARARRRGGFTSLARAGLRALARWRHRRLLGAALELTETLLLVVAVAQARAMTSSAPRCRRSSTIRAPRSGARTRRAGA